MYNNLLMLHPHVLKRSIILTCVDICFQQVQTKDHLKRNIGKTIKVNSDFQLVQAPGIVRTFGQGTALPEPTSASVKDMDSQ